METFVLFLLLLLAVLLSSVLDQLIPKVSLPLVQIALGVLIALSAFTPLDIRIDIDPNLFILVFIAPLIFDESRRIDKKALWENKKPVLSLAIGLVIVACLVTGFVLNIIIPSIPLAAAFALGAALGPTDAVAVSSLSKEINLKTRQKNVLEAESLINDASGIVTFQFALMAAVTGAFSLIDASGAFVFSFFGGIAVGAVLALIFGFVIRRIRAVGLDNIMFHVLYEVCMPFIIYLIANEIGVSGILALVTAGLMNVMSPKTMGPSQSRLNIVSNSVWSVVTFGLNGIVFVILGAQLPGQMMIVWENNPHISGFELIGYAILLTLLLAAIRFVWLSIMRLLEIRKEKKIDPSSKFKKADIRDTLVMTFAGARGAITLALIMTIPVYLANGNGFPQRSLITFLASGVIILTLLLATFLVPLIAPKKEEVEQDAEKEREYEVIIEILRNVIEELAATQTKENRRATQQVIKSYNERINRIKENHEVDVEPNTELRIKTLRWEQDCVIGMIDKEEIDPVVGYQYINRMAQIQNLIMHRNDNFWMFRNAFRHVKVLMRSIIHSIKLYLPGETHRTEHEAAMREIQINCAAYVLDKLHEEISNPDAPTEDVSRLLLEYQRLLASLRNSRISVTAIAKNAEEKADVERRGLTIEREQIQAMYEAGKLSRSSVKRLRENVSLMQIDLEDHI